MFFFVLFLQCRVDRFKLLCCCRHPIALMKMFDMTGKQIHIYHHAKVKLQKLVALRCVNYYVHVLTSHAVSLHCLLEYCSLNRIWRNVGEIEIHHIQSDLDD